MELLKRKIDKYLIKWKNSKDKKPLIVKGARQIGKTESIRNFAKKNYKSVIEINFILQKQFKDIFDDGFEVDNIIKNISLRNPNLEFIPGNTLIFFDELLRESIIMKLNQIVLEIKKIMKCIQWILKNFFGLKDTKKSKYIIYMNI